MRFPSLHPWDVSVEQATAIQDRLRAQVVMTDTLGPVSHVAGIDVGLADGDARAAIAVLSFPDLVLVDSAVARRPITFPYIPGLLSFREIPALLQAFEGLRTVPDLILCDGQGIAHPRRLGIASHLGVLTALPTIGVAKKRLVGRHDPVPDSRGAWQPMTHAGEVIGAALRTRPHVKPVFISSGHRVSLETAVAYVMRCTTRYRLPETTRWAHRLASGDRPAAATRPPRTR
jgi:deoxyribonuclease V